MDRLIGALLALLEKLITWCMSKLFTQYQKRNLVVPQRVRWQSAETEHGPGILVWVEDPKTVERDPYLIPWNELRSELEQSLLPLVFADATGYKIVTSSFLQKKAHTVQIVDAAGKPVMYVWFGPNPDREWRNDEGLIHIGGGSEAPIVWQTYRRLSDGTYERLSSVYRNYENTPLEKRERAIRDIATDNARSEEVREG
jgi:hypothetical protein